VKYCTCSQLGQIGRLGNQLFQVAGTLAYGIRTDSQVCLDPEWPYRPYFSIPDEYYRVAPPHAVDRRGYMQDRSLFAAWWPQIKKLLRFSPLAEREYPASGSDAGCLAIHWRRGDYTLYPWRFIVLDRGYYEQSIKLLQEKGFSWRNFGIFTDDPQYVYEQNLPLSGAGFTSGKFLRMDDLFTMMSISKCGLHIIGNSTFSWWGAQLSDTSRAVVMPLRWGVPGDEFQKRSVDLQVPGWYRV